MIEISKIQSSILGIIEKYKELGLLSDKFQNEFSDLFVRNTLRIGVIGKMKAGKSSFLNALIFGDKILPTGDKPVTVTLTEISYAETDRAEVQFLTEDDISAIRKLANLDSEDFKSKEARKLIKCLEDIEGGYQQYTNKGTIKTTLESLEDFVSEKGQYSGLAKSVKIFINDNRLKGITIIDTPGFNDPIASRGEDTKNAIKTCQIILFVHDVLDKYDTAELEMAKEQFEYAGISEVIEVINKTDLEEDYEISDWHFIKEEFQNTKREVIQSQNDSLSELLGSSSIICVSSLMALYGQIDDIRFDDFDLRKYNEFRARYSQLNTSSDFVKYSGITEIETAINEITQKGGRYLLESPIYKLLGELKSIKDRLDSEKKQKQQELDLLKKGRDDYEKEMEAIDELIGVLYDALNNATSISPILTEIVNEGRNKIYFVRSSKIENEFTDTRFLEPSTFSSGVKKQNLSAYSEILLSMDGSVRVELDDIKSKLLSEAKNYVSNFVHDTLYNTSVNVTDKERSIVESPLQDALAKRIGEINIPVETDRPSTFVTGKQTQKSLYRSKFQSQYSDQRIEDDFMSKYLTNLSHVPEEFVTNGRKNLNKLKEKLIKKLNYTPQQKDEAISKLNEEIEALNKTLTSLDGDIESVNKLIPEK